MKSPSFFFNAVVICALVAGFSACLESSIGIITPTEGEVVIGETLIELVWGSGLDGSESRISINGSDVTDLFEMDDTGALASFEPLPGEKELRVSSGIWEFQGIESVVRFTATSTLPVETFTGGELEFEHESSVLNLALPFEVGRVNLVDYLASTLRASGDFPSGESLLSMDGVEIYFGGVLKEVSFDVDSRIWNALRMTPIRFDMEIGGGSEVEEGEVCGCGFDLGGYIVPVQEPVPDEVHAVFALSVYGLEVLTMQGGECELIVSYPDEQKLVSFNYTAGTMMSGGVDADGDGYVCEEDGGDDCDDEDASAHPGAFELCDGMDNDCDPGTPDGMDENWNGVTCDGPDFDTCEEGIYKCNAGDQICTDNSGEEVEVCNGTDDDCDGEVDEGFDEDADGWTVCEGDCDDEDAAVNPGAVESLGSGNCQDGSDNDCDGLVDAQDPACVDECIDSDGDGFFTGSDTCGPLDCDDGDVDVHPGAVEFCDGKDNDCDPATADGAGEGWLGDACDGPDSDLCEEGSLACVGGELSCTDETGDNPELCNGLDDDCNPETADGSGESWIGGACDGSDADFCEDGVYGCVVGEQICVDEAGGNVESCNGLDDDCDGAVDEDFDQDGDGWTVCGGDCDDDNAAVNPGLAESLNSGNCIDGFDNDCDGLTDVQDPACVLDCTDDDGDGFFTEGGNCGLMIDCDDGDASVYPGADELCDGKDNDCDPATDDVCETDEDLVAWYQFDGDMLDSSGNGRHGDPYGVEIVDGLIEGAAAFDTGDYIDIGDFDLSGSQMTIAGWINPDNLCSGEATSCDARIISKADGVNPVNHWWMLSGISAGGDIVLRFRLKTGGTTSTLIADSGNIENNVWTHVAAVYDGSSMILYKDGLEVGSMQKSGTISTGPGVDVWVGNNPTGDRPFDGRIDDLRVYSKALSEIEIQQMAFPECVDVDGDGYGDPACVNCLYSEWDCDDSDSAVHPGAEELCDDGKDNDCDGYVDLEDLDCLPECIDSDGDGYYQGGDHCGLVDCNDNDASVYPGADEMCDGKDNDCDMESPDGVDEYWFEVDCYAPYSGQVSGWLDCIDGNEIWVNETGDDGSNQITLAWRPPSSGPVVHGSMVHYGTVSIEDEDFPGCYQDSVDVLDYTCAVISKNILDPSQTYYFTSTAYNDCGDSDFSDEVTYEIQ